jgi:hypothetical protein
LDWNLLLLLCDRLSLNRAWRDRPLNVGAFTVLFFRHAEPASRHLNKGGLRFLNRSQTRGR